jgi:chromosome segregation ATPase
MPKTLTPEDIKLHVTDIFNFISEESKTYTQIQRHNWRFRSIKNILIKKNIIFSHYKINSKKTYYKSAFLKLQPHHLLHILEEFKNDIKKQNEKLVDNFIKKDRTTELEHNKKETLEECKNSEYEKEIKDLEFKLNIETTANGCFKQRIRELEKIPSSARELKSIHEKEIKKLTNQIEVANKDLETFQEEQIKIKEAIDDLSKINDFLENQNKKLLSEKLELDSKLKQQIQEHAKRFDELVKERNNYISEYSNYINEKLVEIADLKNKLLKENKIVCYKIFGITIFKVTTNKRN